MAYGCMDAVSSHLLLLLTRPDLAGASGTPHVINLYFQGQQLSELSCRKLFYRFRLNNSHHSIALFLHTPLEHGNPEDSALYHHQSPDSGHVNQARAVL